MFMSKCWSWTPQKKLVSDIYSKFNFVGYVSPTYVRWFTFSLWNISSLCYNWSISPHLWCLNSHLFILSTFSRVSPLLTAYTALTIPRVSRFWWEAIALSNHPVAPGTAVPPPSSHTPSRMPEAKASMRGRSARSPWRKGSVRDRPWQERWWKEKCVFEAEN